MTAVDWPETRSRRDRVEIHPDLDPLGIARAVWIALDDQLPLVVLHEGRDVYDALIAVDEAALVHGFNTQWHVGRDMAVADFREIAR